jgi:hypothetical protein
LSRISVIARRRVIEYVDLVIDYKREGFCHCLVIVLVVGGNVVTHLNSISVLDITSWHICHVV